MNHYAGGESLIVRADGGPHLGSGHVMRSLALAQAWQATHGTSTFVLAQSAPVLEARLRAEGMTVHRLAVQPGSADDAVQTVSVAQGQRAQWMVVDGYHFAADYQCIVKEADLRLLCIDDYVHAAPYCADIVLNQNISANASWYTHIAPYTQLLLGGRYALLRREFLAWHDWRRETPATARRVVVSLGGADPDNVTLKVLQALWHVDIPDLEVVVLVGGCNPHHDVLDACVRAHPQNVRLQCNVTSMPDIMSWADMAVSAGGTTCWELALMGLPSLVISLADNQRRVAQALHTTGTAVHLGWHTTLSTTAIAQAITGLARDASTRQALIHRGQALIDGKGAHRAVLRMRGMRLRLRPVVADDCRLLWDWANDPEVRAASFSSPAIPWDDHVAWFAGKLQDPHCFHFIAQESEHTCIGQVRFETRATGEADIHVSIARHRRRSGYGSLLIALAVDELFRVTPIRAVHAFIKPENTGSIKAFEHAEFCCTGVETIHGCTALHYLRVYDDHHGNGGL